jgi:type IV pilus assembly protein PilA
VTIVSIARRPARRPEKKESSGMACSSSRQDSDPSAERDGTILDVDGRMRRAFTLIELLIVIVIIGILAAIAIPKFANSKSKSYYAAMKNDLRNLVTAEAAFFSDSGKYTSNLGSLKFQASNGVNPPVISAPGGHAWSATVTHSQMASDAQCAISVGMGNPLAPTDTSGAPVCK